MFFGDALQRLDDEIPLHLYPKALISFFAHWRRAHYPPHFAQRTQYPLIKEYALNYRGLSIMI